MEGTKLLIVLLATAGVLCDEAATEGEKALECGAGELLFEGSCWWDDDDGRYTWAEAEDVCKARRMSLASVHSEVEAAFVFAGGRISLTVGTQTTACTPLAVLESG